MKRFLFILPFLIIGCHSESSKENTISDFEISGTVTNHEGIPKIYLNYIIGNNQVLMDSAEIKNDRFKIKGKITFPQKAQLQCFSHGDYFPFILYGEKIDIQLDCQNITNGVISNSAINKQWDSLRNKSKEIYGEIEYYFPLFQKARMENDFTTLEKLQKNIDSIDQINRKFLLNYINSNPDTPLSALILNDLYNNPKNDSLEILKMAQKINPNFKKALKFNAE